MDEKQKIAVLKKLIQLKTINDHETQAANYLAALFAPYPQAKVQRLTYAPGRDNLVVTIGESGPILGLSGHLDVVAPGNLADWQNDPFIPEIRAGKLYGRGAADMKSGLAAIVVAMLELLAKKQPLAGRIRLLATVGEETGEYGAAQLTKAGFADYLAGLLIAEPTDGFKKLIYTSRGVIDYQVISIGKAAHSARPQFGINAIDNLLTFYRELKIRFAKFTKIDPILGGITHSITKINGGEQVNSIPSKAEMMGNIRTIPAYPNRVFYETMENLINELNQKPGFKLSLTYSFPEEAIFGTPDSPIIQTAQKVYQRLFGHPVEVTGSLGANDGAEFLQAKGNFNSIELGPGSQTSHQSNEYVEINTYLQAIEFYQQFAIEFLKQQQ
ncbi:ArgE/DapE family deacylase [Liquorilactobacillus vini]|uniref:ArgE/DapE family deacylase n=1 Tax=Liquorilactobacillus vini TaxID=238015 RepID=UPI00029A1F56|nr:ArgE/DapE family deacylase [Liquorilactobacillus vini]